MKSNYLLKQLNYSLPRTAIEAESAVPILVYLYIVIMVHKYRQSAKRIRSNKNILFEVFPLTIGSGKTIAFENRWSRYKELGKKVPQAYL